METITMKHCIGFGILISTLLVHCNEPSGSIKSRIIVCTDINNAAGDPDDKQSMGHLLMYADELDIRAIIADRWDADGINATLEAIDAYEKDFMNPATHVKAPQYPSPDSLRSLIAANAQDAQNRIIAEARNADDRPLWILVWGNMITVRDVLKSAPDIADRIRLFTIGTHLRIHGEEADCRIPNWNGPGRNEVFNDPRFNKMWWIESDWTYAGMFIEPGPAAMLDSIAQYGELGHYIWQVVQPFDWAHYFRVGDTPSVTYLLDPRHDPDDPESPSWAGRYIRPFPVKRPNYYTGINGGLEWNYQNPCDTWEHAKAVEQARMNTLYEQRQNMYNSYIRKMKILYP